MNVKTFLAQFISLFNLTLIIIIPKLCTLPLELIPQVR